MVKGSSIVTAVAQVTGMMQVQSLAWELLHAVDAAKKKERKKKKEKRKRKNLLLKAFPQLTLHDHVTLSPLQAIVHLRNTH